MGVTDSLSYEEESEDCRSLSLAVDEKWWKSVML